MPRPGAIEAARKFREKLAAREAEAAARMGRIYARIYVDMEGDIGALVERLAGMEEIKIGQAWELARGRAILAQVAEEAEKFGVIVQGEVATIQGEAIEQGVDDALRLMEASLPEIGEGGRRRIVSSFTRLHSDAVESVAGLLGAESPLATRLQEAYGEFVAESVKRHLLTGVAAGLNPREIARKMMGNLREGMGPGLSSALTTVRTAQIKSYQLANQSTYLANPNIVPMWIWHSALDGRTCMSCVNLHGSEHPATETMRDHHNGRCAPLPKTISYRDLGIPIDEITSEIERGEDWFNRQAESVQREMMGPGMYQAWKEGKFEFGDLTKSYEDDVYGELLRENSLKDLLGGNGKGRSGVPSGPPPRPRSDFELESGEEIQQVQQAYQAALASGNAGEAEGLKGYLDTLQEMHKEERDLNEAVWTYLQKMPNDLSRVEWEYMANNLRDEGYELYKKYSKEGINLKVQEMRGAKFDGYADVGGKVVQVQRGQFSVREAARIRGQMWDRAQDELSEAYGELLQRVGFTAEDIQHATFGERRRVVREIGRKEPYRKARGDLQSIDQVPSKTRRILAETVDYDLAAVCDLAAQDPLNVPTIDAYRKMQLADIIESTRF